MYGREKRVLLREYLEQGLTKMALAVKLGLSRRTIHHWIETGSWVGVWTTRRCATRSALRRRVRSTRTAGLSIRAWKRFPS